MKRNEKSTRSFVSFLKTAVFTQKNRVSTIIRIGNTDLNSVGSTKLFKNSCFL
jgi:hypothetical protein